MEVIKYVENIIEKPVYVEQIIEKKVTVIVEKIVEIPVERIVEVPVEIIIERAVPRHKVIEQETVYEKHFENAVQAGVFEEVHEVILFFKIFLG